MATISINELPPVSKCLSTDRIRVYTLSNNAYIPSVINVTDLSCFIMSGTEMDNLKQKYDSLTKTYHDFQIWMRQNFFHNKTYYNDTSEGRYYYPGAEDEICTSAYFKRVYDSVYSIDKVKLEVMDEYAVPQDLENLKAAVYAYIENIALSYGSIRGSILSQVRLVNLQSSSSSSNDDKDED